VKATSNNNQDYITSASETGVVVEVTYDANADANDRATVNLSDGSASANSAEITAVASSTVDTAAFDASALADGNVQLTVNLTDLAGNTARTTDVHELRVDDVAPVLLSIDQEAEEIVLNWAGPIDPDVAGYRIYRAEGDGKAQQIVQIDDPAASEFRDSPPTVGGTYSYRVTALDEVPNESEASYPMQTVYIDLQGPEPPRLSGEVRDDMVFLRWIWPEDNEAVSYALLFRGSGDGEAQFLMELNTEYFDYLDRDVEAGMRYRYFIRAVDTLDNLGPQSNPVQLTLPGK